MYALVRQAQQKLRPQLTPASEHNHQNLQLAIFASGSEFSIHVQQVQPQGSLPPLRPFQPATLPTKLEVFTQLQVDPSSLHYGLLLLRAEGTTRHPPPATQLDIITYLFTQNNLPARRYPIFLGEITLFQSMRAKL